MLKHVLLLFGTLLLAIASSFSQGWMGHIPVNKGKTPTFFETRDAFKNYYDKYQEKDNRALKKFYRWEWFTGPRIDESGYTPSKLYWEQRQLAFNSRSGNKGVVANWEALGPFSTPLWSSLGIVNGLRSGAGRVECIEFHPTNDQVFWIGTHSGGLWKTSDGGETWHTTTNGLSSLGISDIVVHPENSDILYLATGDRDSKYTFSIGVLKSLDGGETWQQAGLINDLPNGDVINELMIHPYNPDTLLAVAETGIYKTLDGGANWVQVATGTFKDIEYKPENPEVVYATTFDFQGGAHIYKSEDGGDNFSNISGSLNLPDNGVVRIALAVSPANPEVVYAIACGLFPDTKLVGVYKSTDSGLNWEKTLSGNDKNILGRSPYGDDSYSQAWYNLTMAVSPTNANEIYAGGINVWKSTDGGYNWTILTHESPNIVPGVDHIWVDSHELRINSNTGVVFLANDGGIYKSPDNGSTWIDLSDGLNILQVYKIGTSVSDSSTDIVGCQDQFAMCRTSNGWEAHYTGEAGEHFMDYTNPQIIYSSGFGMGLVRSEDGGYTYQNINPVGINSDLWLQPFAMHPQNPSTIYFAFRDIYKSQDRGDSWTKISNNLSSSLIESLEIAKSDEDYIYAASISNIWKTENGGGSWQNILAGLPNYYIADIAVSSIDPEKVWVCFANFYGGQKVFKSVNGGESWENISGNLPNLPANCLVYQSGSPDGIYVGTDAGVYYIDSTLTEWINYSQGMPNVIVNELEIQMSSKKLRAGTYGRGLWETDIYDSGLNVAFASFFASDVQVCGDDFIEFTDNSLYNPTEWNWEFFPNTVTFIDATNASSQNPKVKFIEDTSYSVSLTVSNGNGNNTVVYQDYVVHMGIKAAFSTDKTIAYPGGKVVIIDESVCNPESWLWAIVPETFSFVDGTNQNSQNPVVVFDQIGNYSVTLTATNSFGQSQTVKENLINVGLNYCMNSDDVTISEGYFYDSKGPNENYSDNESSLFTFRPVDENKVLQFRFTQFNVEAEPNCGYDYLEIYDGTNINANLIGKYCGTSSPGTVIATNSEGALTFLFVSDLGVTASGWKAQISSVYPNHSEKIVLENNLKIVPNPSHGQFKVELQNCNSGFLKLNIYSMSGKYVYAKRFGKQQGPFVHVIDLEPMPKGIYTLELITEKESFKRKVFVE